MNRDKLKDVFDLFLISLISLYYDARAFLFRCKKQYDLVDFAYLDSHSAFFYWRKAESQGIEGSEELQAAQS